MTIKVIQIPSTKGFRVPSTMTPNQLGQFNAWWALRFPEGFPVDKIYFMEAWVASQAAVELCERGR